MTGLYKLSSLLTMDGTSILHVAAGCKRVALVTSINTILMFAPAAADSPFAPLTRQLRWFQDPLKGIACISMRDDNDLLIATHDASVYVISLDNLMACPMLPVGDDILPSPREPSRETITSEGEMLAVAALAGGRALGVSCCTLCDAHSGPSAAIGTLEGNIHLVDLSRRVPTCTADAEAPLSRLYDLPAMAPTTPSPGNVLQTGIGLCGGLLVRTLQGKYLLMGLMTSPPVS